jgi:hypothetical protein
MIGSIYFYFLLVLEALEGNYIYIITFFLLIFLLSFSEIKYIFFKKNKKI